MFSIRRVALALTCVLAFGIELAPTASWAAAPPPPPYQCITSAMGWQESPIPICAPPVLQQ
jgi:hypothetical protein